ncbi:MAG: hypothetical protein QW035_02070 [Candidatus Anstonellales archaeon]
MERKEGLDTLRGIAISLMVLDHFLAIVLFQPVETSNLRILTRLAEPIFAVLIGYFLVGRGRERLMVRAVDILLVAFFVNFFYLPIMRKVEILASFLAVYALCILFGEALALLLPAVFLYPLDPTSYFFDYPLPLVFSQAALGMLIRKGSSPWVSLVFLPAALLLPAPYNYTSLCTPIAAFATKQLEKSSVKAPIISLMGRYPLSSYAIQYSLIVLISLFYNLPAYI